MVADLRLSSIFGFLPKLRRRFSGSGITPGPSEHGIALTYPPIPYDLAEDLKLGSATVDAQHDQIFQLALKANGLARHQADRAKLRATFLEFGDLLREHFTYEEKVLANIRHPKLAEHRDEHRLMLAEMDAIRSRVGGAGASDAFHEEVLSILNFMMGVTVGHMLGSDLDCAKALQKDQQPKINSQ